MSTTIPVPYQNNNPNRSLSDWLRQNPGVRIARIEAEAQQWMVHRAAQQVPAPAAAPSPAGGPAPGN